MSFKEPFPPAAQEYIRRHMDDSLTILAFKVSTLFKYPCKPKGIAGQKRRIRQSINITEMEA
jgi:hypothetical protein